MIENLEIVRFLRQENPWWRNGEVPLQQLEPFKRRDFYKIKEKLSDRNILSITGLRRVGKSTLLFQLIDHLLRNDNIFEKNILFLTLDNSFWKTIKLSFSQILNLYGEAIVGKSIFDFSSSDEDQQKFVFLDEVQYWLDWERELKSLYDKKIPIKFVISGSSSLHLYSKSSESLVGRVHHQLIFPFKFLEICRFNCQIDNEKDMNELDTFNWEFRRSIEKSVRKNSPLSIMNFLEERQQYWTKQENMWKNLLDDYLVRGGFPEMINQDLRIARTRLRDYIELILHRDIPQVYKNIRNFEKFKELFFWILKESSQRSNIVNLSSTIGIDRNVVQEYLQALESVYLLRRVPYYTRSTAKSIRTPIKFFTTDIGIQAAYLNFPLQFYEYDGLTLGKVIETVVCDHITRLKFNLESGLAITLQYWYNKRKRRGHEVDLVCELFHKPIPIEVKYQNEIRKSDLKGLKEFMKEHTESPFGFVISKNTLKYDKDEKIIILPLWLFLMAP